MRYTQQVISLISFDGLEEITLGVFKMYLNPVRPDQIIFIGCSKSLLTLFRVLVFGYRRVALLHVIIQAAVILADRLHALVDACRSRAWECRGKANSWCARSRQDGTSRRLREIEKVLQKEDRNHRSNAGSILNREDNAMTDISILYVLVVNKWGQSWQSWYLDCVHKNRKFWSEKIVREITWPTSHGGNSELQTQILFM